MIKALGVVDLFCALGLVFLKFGILESVVLVFIILLLIKSLVFFTSFVSWVDILVVGLMVLAYFGFFYWFIFTKRTNNFI